MRCAGCSQGYGALYHDAIADAEGQYFPLPFSYGFLRRSAPQMVISTSNSITDLPTLDDPPHGPLPRNAQFCLSD